MNIFVYGSIVYDRIMDFPGLFKDHILPDQIHNLSVSFVVNQFKETFGGAGANIAYNLALLEEKPILCGAVGKDFGKYGEHFSGLNLSGVKVYANEFTASAYIMTDKNDNQITGFFPGTMRRSSYAPVFKKSDLLIIAPGNQDEMRQWAERASQLQLAFIFDPGQQIIQFSRQQLRRALSLATVYIVNDYELSLTKKITGYSNEQIRSQAGILITTFGGHGSQIEISHNKEDAKFNIPAAGVKAVKDPTGAGDAYRAGLIKGLKEQWPDFRQGNYLRLDWRRIGRLASLSSAYAVECYGTQNHRYSLTQFKKRYNLTYKASYD